MADLSGSLSTVNNITMFTEAATQYAAMCTKLNKQIPIIFGYVSKYDWIRERVAMVKEPPPPAASLAPVVTKINELLSKPAAEFNTDTEKEIGTYFSQLPTDYASYDFTKLPNNPANHWGQWQVFEIRDRHPFLKGGTGRVVRGWPAKTYNEDPRGSAKVLVFNLADQTEIDWMFQNAHNYGFTWYGPTTDTWVYVGTTTPFSEAYKKKAALGMASTTYHYFVDNQGKEPSGSADLVGWVDKVKKGEIRDGSGQVSGWAYDLKVEAFDGFSNWATIYYHIIPTT